MPAASSSTATLTKPRPALRTVRHSSLRREWPQIAAITPAALLLGLFFIVPAIWAGYASLTDRALLGFGAQETQFIGLDNYRRLRDTPDLGKFVRNTIVFVIGSAVIGQTGLGFLLALLIDHARTRAARLGSVAYAAVLVAWVSPPAFAGAIWGDIFAYRHGALNAALRALGLGRVDMLGEHPMLAVTLADIWRGTAFAMIIFLGALQTIPRGVHEAARLDGASAFQRLRDHTIPLLSHIGAIVLTMTTITTMGAFMLILLLTNGDPAYQTETLALFAFHSAFSTYEIGFGASISVVLLMLNLILAAIYLRIARVAP
jgi:multiple sugar transport system permease protein